MTLAANDFHFGPSYASCICSSIQVVSLGLDGLCALSLNCYIASVALLLMRLSQAFKQGGVRAMFWRFDFPFLMIVFFPHVFRSNMSYIVSIDYLSEGGYQSHCETLAYEDRDSLSHGWG